MNRIERDPKKGYMNPRTISTKSMIRRVDVVKKDQYDDI